VLKRLQYASSKSEGFSGEQKSLLAEAIDEDLEALAREIEREKPPATTTAPETNKQQPKRQVLPAHLPRREICHEPETTVCGCGCELKRIGEDVAEKLDYTPGVFTVERHIRGKWVCRQCQKLTQAPVPAHIIDKGLPTTGLLAQVLVAKYADHLPLYRQEGIFERAGLALSRSTLAQWVGACGVQLQPLVDALKAELLSRPVLHADETPVAMLKPGHGKTHRAYLWSYGTTVFDPLKAVVFDFADSRAGRHAKAFLGAGGDDGWRGTLVCDDYAGYKELFGKRITEAGCLAHARRKFFDLWANHKSSIAEQALKFLAKLYEIESEVRELDVDERCRIRQLKAKLIADDLHAWLLAQRQRVPEGSATAKAIDYSLNRWEALTRYLDDGRLPADNNWIENRIRPIALGRNNWLFAGSLRAGQRAAAIMSLIGSAKMNDLDPYAYLSDLLARLPTHPASGITDLLPHRWKPTPLN
jgi:transposase